MPKRRRKLLSQRPSHFKVATLVAKFILIKIGQLPIQALTLLAATLSQVLEYLIPRVSLIAKYYYLRVKTGRKRAKKNQPKFPPSLLLSLRKKRGRPRKYPLLTWYTKRAARFIKYQVPLKVKAGILAIVLMVGLSFYTYLILTAAYQLPTPTRLTSQEQPLTTEFYDRNGQLLYRLYEGRNRILVTLDELPPYVAQATIAIEDKNFYSHPGIDPLAVARAIQHNLTSNRLEGGSTITQQLIKNSLLSSEKTYQRKIKEIVLALWTESLYTKDQILTMYLNNAPYGGPAWGIEAAAQTYFGKKASMLNLAEAAFLAGLPASPTEYSPYGTKPELGKVRQGQILDQMTKLGFITKQQADKASSEELTFQPPLTNIEAPHFVMYVRDVLSKKYGGRVVSQGGLKVTTTLDLGLQKEVQKIVSEEINSLAALNVQNGAAIVTDSKTGQILAMVGSRDYYYPGFGNYNVTLALRQPGSAIKPITYATAFKKGFIPGNTILDTPVVFNDEWGNGYSPVNYDGKFHGPVSLRVALGSSYNIPAVKLLYTVGVESVVQTARELGITTFTDPKRYGLSLTLGGAEVRMVELVGAYGAFSQSGVLHPTTPILKVTDSAGNILEEYQDNSQMVLQPELAYLITSVLSDNNARTPAFGPASLLNLPKVAVKTGTSDNKKDNWTIGYTTDFVVGVWVGNSDGAPMNPSLASGVTGAAPIWHRIMRGILAKNPAQDFVRPPGIIEVASDGRKDLAVSNILPKALVRVSSDKNETRYFDAFSSYATSSATAAAGNNIGN